MPEPPARQPRRPQPPPRGGDQPNRGGARDEPPQYTRYRAAPGFLSRLRGRDEPRLGGLGGLREERAERRARLRPGGRGGGRRPLTVGRVVRYVLLAIVAWLVLSLVLLLVSAQVQQGKVSASAGKALDSSGPVGLSANTILVLGSDARTKKTNDTGAALTPNQPSRSDTILLLRTGIGHSGRLSIPRDTVVDIPGHGQDKINAAYAIGGPALAITTVKQFLGIEVNHVIEVNFDNFPALVDSLGGIDVKTGCVRDLISGGDSNGGVTVELKAGTNHLDGRHALALARVRKNSCAPGENDLDRAKRQQKILAAIKSRVTSPTTFFRLPWVSWNAPKAIRSDMSGPSLLGLFGSLALSSSPAPNVLKPSGYVTLPGGGSGLTVSPGERRSAVKRFLGG